MLFVLKTRKYILPMFQKKTQSLKNKLFFLMIPNREGWNYLAVKNYHHL